MTIGRVTNTVIGVGDLETSDQSNYNANLIGICCHHMMVFGRYQVEKMTSKEFDLFFHYVDKIAHMEGSWKEKGNRLLEEAKSRDSETNLQEICDWILSLDDDE